MFRVLIFEFLSAFKGNPLQIRFAKRQRKINNILASIELNMIYTDENITRIWLKS